MASHDTVANQLPPQVSVEAVGPTTDARRWERLAAGLGIIFVALQLGAGAMLGGAPPLDATPLEIQSYLVDDGRNVLLAATMGALAAFFGAGLVTITLATTASLPTVALAWDDTAALAEPGLLQAVWNLNTLALVPIGSSAGAFCLAAALVVLRTRVLPAWLGWIGVLAAVVGVIAVFFTVADDPDSPLGTPANLGGFLLSMLFILLLSIFMVSRDTGTEPASN